VVRYIPCQRTVRRKRTARATRKIKAEEVRIHPEEVQTPRCTWWFEHGQNRCSNGQARSQKRDYLCRSNQIAKHSKARLVTIMITTKASSDTLRTPSISSKTNVGSRLASLGVAPFSFATNNHVRYSDVHCADTPCLELVDSRTFDKLPNHRLNLLILSYLQRLSERVSVRRKATINRDIFKNGSRTLKAQCVKDLWDRHFGKPKQDVSVSGGIVHAPTRDPFLAALPKEVWRHLPEPTMNCSSSMSRTAPRMARKIK